MSPLRCKESESPHAVTVYMLEPQTCQYILGVRIRFSGATPVPVTCI